MDQFYAALWTYFAPPLTSAKQAEDFTGLDGERHPGNRFDGGARVGVAQVANGDQGAPSYLIGPIL